MKVSQKELFGAAAILLYIVFFSHSPPAILRNLLGNTVVSVLVLAVLSYVTLYQSRTIGVLAILAFLLTMTRVTEHLDASVTSSSPGASTTTTSGPTPPTNTPTPLSPPTPSLPATGTTMDTSGNIVNSEGVVVEPSGTPISPATTGVTASAVTAPAPAQPPPPPATLPPPPTAPATPPVASAPPAPVMSCNIESFASF